MWYTYYIPQFYPRMVYYPNPYVRQPVQPMVEQEQKPYLTTWPYSNIYYGNYFES
ncbi:hypothetical protein [Bacillus manliponensis]|uniref:hypothetical protein n=1 Tax=Bacillus manliponensis TaxID=574376 RepID=UPI003510FFA5